MTKQTLKTAQALATATDLLTRMIEEGLATERYTLAAANALSETYNFSREQSIIIIEEALKYIFARLNQIDAVKADARRIMDANVLPYATIWETKTSKTTGYGFNFENKPVGFTAKEGGVIRTVVDKIFSNK